jgi:hypothetical protein
LEKTQKAAATSGSDRSSVSVLDPPNSKSRKSDSETLDAIDGVENPDENSDENPDEKPMDSDPESTPAPAIVWLEDSQCELRRGSHDRIELWVDGELHAASVFIVKTFPSKYPAGYLSVRSWKENGEEYECGMIRELAQWRISNRTLIEEMIERRYLMRRILRVRKNQLESGYLTMDVETDRGPCTLTMRWTQSQALEYSENGKLLIDTCENRYVVEDIDALPAEDRERFLQFIYW